MLNYLGPDFLEFSNIKIASNGNWILRNGWNIPLATLDPAVARDVVYDTEQITWYGSSYRSFHAPRLYVVTNNKIYPSRLENDQKYLSAQFAVLKEKLAIQDIPLSENPTSPFSIYESIARWRYIFMGLFVLALFSPLLLFRKPPESSKSGV